LVGALKIVASSTVGNYVLPYLIGAFKQMHPSVAIDMEVCNTGHAEELIVNGSMDLGFVEGEVSNDQISTLPWLQDELMVIASPASEIGAQKTFRVPEDLERCEWIMREKGSGTAQIFKKKLGRHVTGLKVVMELGHTEAIKKAVESGAGVACLSKLAVCREVEQGWLAGLPVEGIDMKRTLQIIQYKKKASTNLMEEFINFCALLNECSQGCACLSSPWKLQDLLAKSCRQPGA
jgi:DNA-binding transcriptional LysR family regulator